jgi:hypothetical protein
MRSSFIEKAFNFFILITFLIGLIIIILINTLDVNLTQSKNTISDFSNSIELPIYIMFAFTTLILIVNIIFINFFKYHSTQAIIIIILSIILLIVSIVLLVYTSSSPLIQQNVQQNVQQNALLTDINVNNTKVVEIMSFIFSIFGICSSFFIGCLKIYYLV